VPAVRQKTASASIPFGVTCRPFFSLKGWNTVAQGNALGGEGKQQLILERAQQMVACLDVSCPFRAKPWSKRSIARALPWAALFRPFGALARRKVMHYSFINVSENYFRLPQNS
jgi:hypothetical protein